MSNSDVMQKIASETYSVGKNGFVRLVNWMGYDSSIVQAARVSYGSGTKTVREDKELIRYLMRKGHTSPLEHCEIQLHVRVPMDAWRQWVRNRTAQINEYSTRYSEAIDLMETTNPSEWRTQSRSNRQGSETDFLPTETGESLSQGEKNIHELCRAEYHRRLSLGVAREQARKDLPLSNMTEAYWKIDLHNLLHNFLAKRLKPDAQLEIRRYAEVVARIVKQWVPYTWEAFEDYVLGSMTLSKSELNIISHRKLGASPLSSSEVKELLEKCVRLGVVLES